MPRKTFLIGVLILTIVSSAAWYMGHRSKTPSHVATHSAPAPVPSDTVSPHFGNGRDDDPELATKKSQAQSLAADFTLAYFSGSTPDRQSSLRLLVTPDLYARIQRQRPVSTGLRISIDESTAFIGGEAEGKHVTIDVRFQALHDGASFGRTFQTSIPITMTSSGYRVYQFPEAPVEVPNG